MGTCGLRLSWSLYGLVITILDCTSVGVCLVSEATIAFQPSSATSDHSLCPIIVIFKSFWSKNRGNLAWRCFQVFAYWYSSCLFSRRCAFGSAHSIITPGFTKFWLFTQFLVGITTDFYLFSMWWAYEHCNALRKRWYESGYYPVGTTKECGTPERYKDAVWTVQKIPMQSAPSLIDGALMAFHIPKCVQCVVWCHVSSAKSTCCLLNAWGYSSQQLQQLLMWVYALTELTASESRLYPDILPVLLD
jgi:hypothetical protein